MSKRSNSHRSKKRWFLLAGVVLVIMALSTPRHVGFFLVVLVLLGAGLVFWRVRRWFLRRIKENAPDIDEPIASFQTPPRLTPLGASFVMPTLGDVLTLTAGQFEELTRDLLAALGFQGMTRTGGAGDLGVDVVGRDRQDRTVVVQCKRFAPGNQVGSPAVQSFIGMMTVQHHAECGVFVTSSTFSQPAIDLARAHAVTLIDGAVLLTLMALTGLGCPVPAPAIPQPAPTTSLSPSQTATTWPTGNGQNLMDARSPHFCTNCGADVDDAEVFCSSCGQKIKRAPEPR